ncbi:MAG: LiaI-LiaF-like domain-containing protein [Candidatus Zixiibacteriota bacterium]
MFVGILLLLIGMLMLLERLGLIYGGLGEYILPVALVALGASMVFKSNRNKYGN